MIGSPDRRPRKNIEEAIEMAGNSHKYQMNILILFLLQFLFSAFIEMGFPVIFRAAVIVCADGNICDENTACLESDNPELSPTVQSVAFTFNLVCSRKKYLNICFNAFLYGGFFGSFYYGEIQERRGRKYVVHESMAIMLLGIIVSFFSGSVTIFSIAHIDIGFKLDFKNDISNLFTSRMGTRSNINSFNRITIYKLENHFCFNSCSLSCFICIWHKNSKIISSFFSCQNAIPISQKYRKINSINQLTIYEIILTLIIKKIS